MPRDHPDILPVTRPRRAAQASYDRLSRWYDALEGNWEARARAAGLQRLAIRPGESVLEIGSGPGHSLAALAEAGARACGLDLSRRMLAVAAARLRAGGHAPRVALCQGDGVHLPCRDAAFDAVFMSFTLELFDTPDIDQVLGECRRVLRPGGRIGVVALSRDGPPSRLRDLYEWGHVHFPGLLDCRPIYGRRALEAAGMQTLQAETISLWGLPVDIVVASV